MLVEASAVIVISDAVSVIVSVKTAGEGDTVDVAVLMLLVCIVYYSPARYESSLQAPRNKAKGTMPSVSFQVSKFPFSFSMTGW